MSDTLRHATRSSTATTDSAAWQAPRTAAVTLSRWRHILLPIVLIGIGLIILIKGHACGL